MMLFTIFSATAISYGRADIDLLSAFYFRYHAIQMFYFIGVVWLVLLYREKRNELQRTKRRLMPIFILILLIFWTGGITDGNKNYQEKKVVEKKLMTNGLTMTRQELLKLGIGLEVTPERVRTLKRLKYNFYRE